MLDQPPSGIGLIKSMLSKDITPAEIIKDEWLVTTRERNFLAGVGILVLSGS